MHERILVPLDGSRFAEAALPMAMGLARRLDASLDLVTVREPLPAYAHPGWDEDAGEAAETYLRETGARVGAETGREVSTAVLKGPVVEQILRRFREHGAAMTVLTTHGRGPVSRAWLGSVADRLVRESEGPVIAIRPDETDLPMGLGPIPRLRRVLVPLDGSSLAESILDPLVGVLGDDPEYVLLRVTQYPNEFASPYLPDTIRYNREVLEAWEAEAQGYLDEVAERLAASGLRIRTRVEVATRPPATIVHFAEEMGMDLIAMATHGRGGLTRLVLGSVADKVVRTCAVPIFIRRPLRATAHADAPRTRAAATTGEER